MPLRTSARPAPPTLCEVPTHTNTQLNTTSLIPSSLTPQVFLSGPLFKGIKMLPPGVHFLSFQARSSRDGTLSPPVSTFLLLQPQQVVVRRWDAASEGLVELEEEEVGFWVWGLRFSSVPWDIFVAGSCSLLWSITAPPVLPASCVACLADAYLLCPRRPVGMLPAWRGLTLTGV